MGKRFNSVFECNKYLEELKVEPLARFNIKIVPTEKIQNIDTVLLIEFENLLMYKNSLTELKDFCEKYKHCPKSVYLNCIFLEGNINIKSPLRLISVDNSDRILYLIGTLFSYNITYNHYNMAELYNVLSNLEEDYAINTKIHTKGNQSIIDTIYCIEIIEYDDSIEFKCYI